MDGWMDRKTAGQQVNGGGPTHGLQGSRAEMDACMDRRMDKQVNRQTDGEQGSDSWVDRQTGGQGCPAGAHPATHGCSPGARSRSCPGRSGCSAGRGRGACTRTALPAPGTRCCGSPAGRTGRLWVAGPAWGRGCPARILPTPCLTCRIPYPIHPCDEHGPIPTHCAGCLSPPCHGLSPVLTHWYGCPCPPHRGHGPILTHAAASPAAPARPAAPAAPLTQCPVVQQRRDAADQAGAGLGQGGRGGHAKRLQAPVPLQFLPARRRCRLHPMEARQLQHPRQQHQLCRAAGGGEEMGLGGHSHPPPWDLAPAPGLDPSAPGQPQPCRGLDCPGPSKSPSNIPSPADPPIQIAIPTGILTPSPADIPTPTP